MAPATAYAANTLGIDPEFLYTHQGWIRSSGISKTRIREARLQGLDLPTIAVGKRLFIRGRDGIAYIEKLAAIGPGR